MAEAAPSARVPFAGNPARPEDAGVCYAAPKLVQRPEQDIQRMLQARLGSVGLGGLQRSGSAPPNLFDELDSPLNGFGGSWRQQKQQPSDNGCWNNIGHFQPGPAGDRLSIRATRELEAVTDPSYVEYYYNHKNINPRLPPPRSSTGAARENGSPLRMVGSRLEDSAEATDFQKDGAMQPKSLFGHTDSGVQPALERKPRDGSRLQESSSRPDPWSSDPGKGLMGLSPLATRPKSLFVEKHSAGNGQPWDGEYNMNASSPVFGHPSSPFAPQRPIGPVAQDDGSILLSRNSRGSRASSTGLGFGSAPGTPTKRSMEFGGVDSLLSFHKEVGMRLSVPLRGHASCRSSLSTSPPMGSLTLGGDAGRPLSQPVTPTMGGYDNQLHPMNLQELAAVQVAEQLTQQSLEDPIGMSRGPLSISRAESPPCMSPNKTSPQMSPPQESIINRVQSPRPAAMTADLLPDSMYMNNTNCGESGFSQFEYAASVAAMGSMNGSVQQFQPSIFPPPLGDSAAAMQQLHQAQAAAAMSMMYPFYAQQNVHAAALAQAAAMGMGAYPGMVIPGMPPFNPALLMGMYAQHSPGVPGRPPADVAAYHQRVMEMYSNMAAQGGNHGGVSANPSAAMAAAAMAAAAASDPMAASMAAYAAAAAAGMAMPQVNSHSGSGKTSPEPGAERSNHDEERTRGKGGKDAGRRGRRGDSHGRDSSGDDSTHNCALLEQLKSNKSKKMELQDIVGNVIGFCTDQHGSRFIQLKLESSSEAETAAVFKEVLPHAISLMTDVFGNYVVQKFFEHGSDEQRERLADTLTTNVLTLSLQMYGCRVVQKALETLGLERQRMIVAELDGHVMRCVRDQNGNHVIQKCIECVPTHEIAFMVDSFQTQVVMLSAHPYGCRVVQRVLEYCDDPQRVHTVMTEVLSATCQLAQDQYGNYVVQHVLERGAPADRTTIITQLAGQIVEMSQHKFASNVIEKCLQHGSHADRQILIGEIMGRSEENGPLQLMMKDQFGNYVVQKLLEVCDDSQREALLTRIKQHLHNLKKYTYGKHIVARVEKLITNTQRLFRNSGSAAQVLSGISDFASAPKEVTMSSKLPGDVASAVMTSE